GQGCLVVAGLDELVGFVPASKEPRSLPSQPPQTRIDTLYRQARQLAGAGQTTGAAEKYVELREATKERRGAFPISARSSTHWRLLIEGRLQALLAGAASAHVRPGIFTDTRMPPPVRLAAWKRISEASLRQGKLEDAIMGCRQVLQDVE